MYTLIPCLSLYYRRSRDISFTVPPSLSPLVPRRPFLLPSPNSSPRKTFLDKGALSPLSPRRAFPDTCPPSPRKTFDGGMLSPLIPRRFVGATGGAAEEVSPVGLAPDSGGRGGNLADSAHLACKLPSTIYFVVVAIFLKFMSSFLDHIMYGNVWTCMDECEVIWVNSIHI